MSLRKIAGLLAAFGVTIGLIGGGVGAVFHTSVTADELISVGSFDCSISSTSPGAVLGDHTVSYTAPKILSSNAGSRPFQFTVTNVGEIPVVMTVTPPAAQGLFAPIPYLASGSGVRTTGQNIAYQTGIQWTTLTQNYAGSGPYTFTWTVSCDEAP
jgi:hypothetical protein